MSIFEDIRAALQTGKLAEVKALTRQALDEGVEAKSILEDALLAGMGIIGQKFKMNEVYVPEVLVAARAMNAGIAVLKPYLAEDGAEGKGVVVIGTVKGDLHDIGKNLVKLMMEGKGLRVIDLGVNVSAEQFIAAARENNAGIIACSALLTTTMGEMRAVVDGLNASPMAGNVRVMIGGAPVTQSFCDQIGADKYTSSAADAADAALELFIR
ncbi:MAG: corrinoid protein [Oscillospiraceae bacterium]|nr:corrinoid protein [Oscillospiraceae bacterium]